MAKLDYKSKKREIEKEVEGKKMLESVKLFAHILPFLVELQNTV
jgi:hypothetical protein